MCHRILPKWFRVLIGIAMWFLPSLAMAQGPTLVLHTFRDYGFAMQFPDENIHFSTQKMTLAGLSAVVEKVEGQQDDTEVVIVVRRCRFSKAPSFQDLYQYNEELARETAGLGGAHPKIYYRKTPAMQGGLGMKMALLVNNQGFPGTLVVKTKPIGTDLYIVKVIAQDLMVAERIMRSFRVLDESGASFK